MRRDGPPGPSAESAEKRPVEDARPYDSDWIDFVGEHIMLTLNSAQIGGQMISAPTTSLGLCL